MSCDDLWNPDWDPHDWQDDDDEFDFEFDDDGTDVVITEAELLSLTEPPTMNQPQNQRIVDDDDTAGDTADDRELCWKQPSADAMKKLLFLINFTQMGNAMIAAQSEQQQQSDRTAQNSDSSNRTDEQPGFSGAQRQSLGSVSREMQYQIADDRYTSDIGCTSICSTPTATPTQCEDYCGRQWFAVLRTAIYCGRCCR